MCAVQSVRCNQISSRSSSGCDNTSGLRVDTPRFLVQTTTLSSNVIHLAHVDWSAEEIARLPSSAAGEKYTQRSKKDTSWTSLMEKVIQDVSVKLRFGTNVFGLLADKKDRLQKKMRFSTTWTVLQRRWIHEMFDQSSGIECSFQSSDHPKILKTSNEDRVKCQTLVETNV